MKKKSIILSVILLITLLVLLVIPNNVNAILQSNGDTNATKGFHTWMLQIRQMQSSGGTLGLSDTINNSGLTSSNKDLDIHMQKNTEYGAMVILSASSYGNKNKITDGQTTTGNASGIVMKINKEWVAGGLGTGTSYGMGSIPVTANARYIDYYLSSVSGKTHVGDAINIGNWHGSGTTTWFYDNGRGVMIRAYSGSIFSYYADSYGGVGGADVFSDGEYRKAWSSRAAIVVGSGI